MKKLPRWPAILAALSIVTASALTGCKSTKVTDNTPSDMLAGEPERTVEVLVTENPNKNLPMDFATASENSRDSKTFPGAFRIAADAIEVGRASSGSIPNIGAEGEAYLEMPHPDGTPLHIRGNRIRSHGGTVTVSGWPVVVRQGKRLVGTTKDTVIKIGSGGVQALGPSEVEDLVSSGSPSSIDDLLTPLPSLSLSEPFIPLPPQPDPPKSDPPTTVASGTSQKRGIIDGKPIGRAPKRGFAGKYEGTENPKFPGDPTASGIDLTPGTASSDLGVGNIPPLPSLPNE